MCISDGRYGGDMKIVICEDNKPEQKQLEKSIKNWADASEVNIDILCYCSAEEFLFAWPDTIVDVIFIDIKMKEMTGLKLAEKIREVDKNLLIVFITNHLQYSTKGYDVNALHFLVKPVSTDKLFSVLDKAYNIWSSSEKDIIIVTNDSVQVKLHCGDIYYVKMNSHTAELHMKKQIFEIRTTAEEMTKLLPYYFVRSHRSYIVNLFKADCVYKDIILLSTGEKLPISRKNSKYVNDAFVRLFKG